MPRRPHARRDCPQVLDACEAPLLNLACDLHEADLGPHAPPPADGGGDAAAAPAPASGANAVWEARRPLSVRRPAPSDGADGPGPRELREVFVRLKYELREFALRPEEVPRGPGARPADGAALGEALADACLAGEPLRVPPRQPHPLPRHTANTAATPPPPPPPPAPPSPTPATPAGPTASPRHLSRTQHDSQHGTAGAAASRCRSGRLLLARRRDVLRDRSCCRCRRRRLARLGSVRSPSRPAGPTPPRWIAAAASRHAGPTRPAS